MQVGILRQLRHGGDILAKVAEVLAVAREVGLRKFLRHTSLPKNLMGVFQMRQALAWQRKASMDDVHPWFLHDSDAHAIVPELAPRDTEAIFDKIGMSAFEGTPLDTALRDRGVRAFLIVGVAIEMASSQPLAGSKSRLHPDTGRGRVWSRRRGCRQAGAREPSIYGRRDVHDCERDHRAVSTSTPQSVRRPMTSAARRRVIMR